MTKIKLRDIRAAAEATAAAAILIAALTIVGDLWHPLKDALKTVFTHHWLGKGALSVTLFALVYWLRKGKLARNGSVVRSVYWAVAMSWLAAIAMVVFFTLHYYHLI